MRYRWKAGLVRGFRNLNFKNHILARMNMFSIFLKKKRLPFFGQPFQSGIYSEQRITFSELPGHRVSDDEYAGRLFSVRDEFLLFLPE